MDIKKGDSMDKDISFTELGVTGLSRFGGYVDEEWLPELKGIRAIKAYREMADNDPIVGAILFAIEMLCRQVTWHVEGDDRPRAFVESCLDDMSSSFSDIVSEALSMLVYGFSYHEIVYKQRKGDNLDPSMRSKYNDGRIGWRKIPIRSQDTLYQWVFDEAGGIQAMEQLSPPSYQVVRIPIEKALLFRTKSYKGSPEGRSILRNSFKAWWFKKNIEAIEGIGIERDLAGLPIAWIPPNVVNPSTPTEHLSNRTFKDLVTRVRRDKQEGILMPLVYDEKGNKLYDFTLLSTGSRRQFDTNTIISRYDTRIAQTVMADFIMLGTQRVGSFALASSKTELFSLAIGTYLDEIANVFNTYAIPRLLKLNGLVTNAMPKLVHGDIEDVDLETLGNYITKLAGAGAPLFPDQKLEEYLKSVAKLPSEK